MWTGRGSFAPCSCAASGLRTARCTGLATRRLAGACDQPSARAALASNRRRRPQSSPRCVCVCVCVRVCTSQVPLWGSFAPVRYRRMSDPIRARSLTPVPAEQDARRGRRRAAAVSPGELRGVRHASRCCRRGRRLPLLPRARVGVLSGERRAEEWADAARLLCHVLNVSYYRLAGRDACLMWRHARSPARALVPAGAAPLTLASRTSRGRATH